MKKFLSLLITFVITICCGMGLFACNNGGEVASSESSASAKTQYMVSVTNGTGGGVFDKGESVTVTATVPDGMLFKEWVSGGKTLSTENPYTFTVTGNIALTAKFQEIIDESNPYACVDFTVEVESGRDIRVLQITDTQIIDAAQARTADRLGDAPQWATEQMDARVFEYLREIIPVYDPDFIIMTGDLVYGEFDDNGTSLLRLIEFMDSYKIPWAPVFGNHDNESRKGVDWQCEQLENSQYCLFKQRMLTGNGNYSVGIVQGGTLVRVFYMLDSNGCGAMSSQSKANGHSTTVAGFGADQIEFYTNGINRIKEDFPQAKVSMAFHIQLDVTSEALAANGATSGSQFDFQTDDDEETIGFYKGELKTPWDTDKTVWSGIKELGVVDSLFFGHEHGNNASVLYEGIRLGYGLKSGVYDRANYIHSNGSVTVGSYGYVAGTVPMIGATAIEFNSSGITNTYHIYNKKYIEDIEEQNPDNDGTDDDGTNNDGTDDDGTNNDGTDNWGYWQDNDE